MSTQSERVKRWKKANPDKTKATRRAYFERHKEKIMKKRDVYRSKWKTLNPEKARVAQLKSDLKKNFGMSLDQYRALEKNQDGKCAICREPQSNGKRLCVDHCHATQRVRGLLCTRCNTMLGCARDSTSTLLKAIDYLVVHGAPGIFAEAA